MVWLVGWWMMIHKVVVVVLLASGGEEVWDLIKYQACHNPRNVVSLRVREEMRFIQLGKFMGTARPQPKPPHHKHKTFT